MNPDYVRRSALSVAEVDEMRAQLSSLKAEVEDLRGALEPFATYARAKGFGLSERVVIGITSWPGGSANITEADFARTRQALSRSGNRDLASRGSGLSPCAPSADAPSAPPQSQHSDGGLDLPSGPVIFVAEVLAEAIGEQVTTEDLRDGLWWLSGGCTPQTAGCRVNLRDVAEAVLRALPECGCARLNPERVA